ncbi:M1 family aminopeptidase [Clostridiisalibacter paucivorans]|uniref:M1 family aminopeptidase n=1 Tax=Clostridiisalibacter paucivorans TaxID=408753 RepID=UPI00047BAEFA|nr:M1 family aminopeptidase [Clostridiisalibacter paucivorans]
MNNLKLFRNEIKFFVKSKLILSMIGLNILISLWGINSINNSNEMFLHNMRKTAMTMGLGTARYGALSGVLIFAMLAVFILSRDLRKESRCIIDSSLDYAKLNLIRIITLIFYSVIMTLILLILSFAMQIFIFKIPIDISIYIYCYGTILFPAILFSILLSSGIYMISDSMDITFISILVLFFINIFSKNYLLSWVHTVIPVFSDFAGIRPVGKLIIYNRILWLFISSGVFILGYISRRRYDENLFSSFRMNINSKIPVLLFIFFVISSIFIWSKEPYMKTYPSMTANSENIDEDISLKEIIADVELDSEDESMSAHLSYGFENIKNANYIRFDTNEGLNIIDIKVNNKQGSYKKIEKTNLVEIDIPKDKHIDIDIYYNGKIKYDAPWAIGGYICEDSVYLLENSNWIFRPLTDRKDYVEVSGSITAPKKLTVVTPGKTTGIEQKNAKNKWKYAMKSFNTDMAVFAAEYEKTAFEVNDVEIEFYYSPKHKRYIEDKEIGSLIKNMVQFYSAKFGPYYSKELPLKIVETSVYKPGGHSSANVITFAEYMVNREFDMHDYVFVHDVKIIAHEIAHQWWGSAVECVQEIPWSNEGITNYSSYKYIEEEFGKNLAYSNLSMWENAYERSNKGYYMMNPEEMKNLKQSYRDSLQMQKIKGQVYYEMPLKLLKGEEILGEEVFLENISRIYREYFLKELTYDDFLEQMGLNKEMISIE